MERKWYVARVVPGQEGRAQDHLKRQGYIIHRPMIQTSKRKARQPKLRARRQREYQDMFPGYLLIHLNEKIDDFSPIRSTQSCLGLIRMTRREDGYLWPTPMKDSDAEFIISAGGVQPQVEYKSGDKIRAVSGPYEHTEAFIKTLRGKGKEERGMVLMAILGGQRLVEVDLADWEPAA